METFKVNSLHSYGCISICLLFFCLSELIMFVYLFLKFYESSKHISGSGKPGAVRKSILWSGFRSWPVIPCHITKLFPGPKMCCLESVNCIERHTYMCMIKGLYAIESKRDRRKCMNLILLWMNKSDRL